MEKYGSWFVGSFKEDGLYQVLAGDAAHNVTGAGDEPLRVVALVKTETEAHLIAAAPEMLEALKRILTEYRALKGLDDDHATNLATAAIRSAEGA